MSSISLIIELLYVAIFATCFLLISLNDVRCREIPHRYLIALCVLWIIGAVLIPLLGRPHSYLGDYVREGLLGAFALGGGSAVVAYVFESLGRVDAIGGGDIKLLAVIGLFLGVSKGLCALVIGCLAAIIYVGFVWLGRKLKGGKHRKRVPRTFPFAPALTIGTMLMVLL